MEVKKVGRALADRLNPKQDQPIESISFTELMGSRRDQMNVERFNRLIQDIEDQGKVLSQTVTVGDLRKYKQLVKSFMEDAVKYGLKLEETRGFNRRGRPKVYKIVTEVDKKLLDLTNAVLNKQEKGLHILEMVGEIKGLLVNIYT